jgi:hypothetical protein
MGLVIGRGLVSSDDRVTVESGDTFYGRFWNWRWWPLWGFQDDGEGFESTNQVVAVSHRLVESELS